MKIKYDEAAKKRVKVLADMPNGAVVRFPTDTRNNDVWMVLRGISGGIQVARMSDGFFASTPDRNAEVEELVCTLTVEGVK